MFDDFDTQIQCEEVYEYGKYFLDEELQEVLNEISKSEQAEYYGKQ